MDFDTIVALATAPGEGAIGIVRLSGHKAIDIAREIFRTKTSLELCSIENRKMYYGKIMNADQVIDEVMIAFMNAPATYTREDIVEIYCHGGIVPIQAIIRLILSKGARLADRGEFTKRAFLNGRLDLAQAESVMDLISAKSEQGFSIAFEQMQGTLSRKVEELRNLLIASLAHLEVSIDYPEEDIEEITFDELESQMEQISRGLETLLRNAESGRIAREGINTVIVGKPNVGKSSLLNALLKETRAIVTDIPGTTRDAIEEYLNIKGIALKIVDTAGIRETEDVVEKIGVMKSKEFFNKADLVIFILNAEEGITDEDLAILKNLRFKKSIILVNKIDLDDRVDYELLKGLIEHEIVIKTSMMTEEGLEELENAIVNMVYDGLVVGENQGLLSNIRHINALELANSSVKSVLEGITTRMPYDFLQVDMKDAYDYMGEVTGDTVEDTLLEKIFANFCLGK